MKNYFLISLVFLFCFTSYHSNDSIEKCEQERIDIYIRTRISVNETRGFLYKSGQRPSGASNSAGRIFNMMKQWISISVLTASD